MTIYDFDEANIARRSGEIDSVAIAFRCNRFLPVTLIGTSVHVKEQMKALLLAEYLPMKQINNIYAKCKV